MSAPEVHYGPWWCPGCSTAYESTLTTNHGEPCCPKCGGGLEEQGTGDDDPYPDDPTWRD